MPQLALKPTHKPVKAYYHALQETIHQLSLHHEGAVAPHFASLLRHCAGQVGWTLAEQYQIPRKGRKPLRADGVLLDTFNLRHGFWEAKDGRDDLEKEVRKKFAEGYPQDNILFQAPDRAILYQNKRLVLDADIRQPEALVDTLKLFFEYQPPEYEQWDLAVSEFKEKVPELAQSVLSLIERERKTNAKFIQAFANFAELVRQAINPNISETAVEEMLIQHLLTERIFRRVFNNPDFAQRNIIAHEIEKVIEALTSRSFSRADFLRQLDRFYGAIEATAATIEEFSEKQDFLNTVYEKFFQGFSVKVADTHGIVYTPQPIVDFMVRSVDDILKREFGKADGLASQGVAILDPFVGTGNFILRLMRQMPKSRLPHKYAHELFCNEVMLLPYYIASLNIEHEYYELTGQYEPFSGISLVDTFELAEGRQMPLFVQENSQRVQRQKDTPIFVVIGNPPYNAHQVNENDNSKNRKYKHLDARVAETYAAASQASNKNALSDVYVKAFRWAADRLGDEGIVAFVTNNSFLDSITFDGMRKHLAQEFTAVYLLDLGGNVRKNPKLSGSTHNVFGIQVGVSIALLVRKKPTISTQIFYARVDEFWRKTQKYDFLEAHASYTAIPWQPVQPNKQTVWLTEGLQADFETFMPMGIKESKGERTTEALFRNFSNGVKTNRDAWAYNFRADELERNIRRMIETYNVAVTRWQLLSPKPQVDNFVDNDERQINWSENLKNLLQRGALLNFNPANRRTSAYRPFTKQFLYFDKDLTERRYQMTKIFPTLKSEQENLVICVVNEAQIPFSAQITNILPCLHVGGRQTQCFPFYIYDEDGRNSRENITDWALGQFRTRYADETITKWDIFYYVYGLLHHPTYRETYAANLRRELPRLPFVQGFGEFVRAGARLAEIHLHYEQQPEYPLTRTENPALPLDYRVEKMRLAKDKTSLKYNEFLTLSGIPPQAFEYKLGNRSALDWVIDQYQVSTDGRSGIINDPNRLDDETYILRLIGQVITVSLETVAIVQNLPALDILPTPTA